VIARESQRRPWQRLISCYAAIQHSFPGTVRLLLPNREVLTESYRLISGTVWPKFPWAGRVAQITCGGYVRKHRFPTQQTFTWLTFAPKLLAVHGARLKDDAIVGEELYEGVTRPFGSRGLRKGAFHFDQRTPVLVALTLALNKHGRTEHRK